MSGLNPTGLGNTENFSNAKSDSFSTDKGVFSGRPWHDVTDYGAVGDGVTDDSAAVQAAVDAAASGDEMGVVYYPEPNSSYFFGSDVIAKSGVYHMAPRPYSSTITVGDLGTNAVFQGPHINGNPAKNIGFYGLTIDGTGGWSNSPYSPSKKHIFIKPSATDDGSKNLWIECCHTINSPASSIGCDSIVNQHYRYNIVEGAGTDGETTGGNGIGIGVGEVTGECPTWVVGNRVIDTAEFGIILEQTGNYKRSIGYKIRDNLVEDARVGIGGEVVRGADCSGNTIVTSSRMDHAIIWDSLDSGKGPKQVSVNGNDVVHPIGSTVQTNQEALLFGSDASFCSGIGNSIQNGGGDSHIGGSFCAWGGVGEEAAGFGAEPTRVNRWDTMRVSKVHNTDDGAMWSMDDGTGWHQVSPADPSNLSGKTAIAGFRAYDDGTNTTGSGALCQWDSTNSQWVPFDGSATFS